MTVTIPERPAGKLVNVGMRWLALGLWLSALGLLLGALLLPRPQPAFSLVSLAFVSVGAFLGATRPANPVGWLFGAWGLVMALMAFTGSYVGDDASRPGANWLAWAAATLWHPAFALLVFLLLLFPHGHLPSRRWRPAAWLTAAVYGVCMVSAALAPGVTREYFPGAMPVIAVPFAELAEDVFWGLLVIAQFSLLGTGVLGLAVKLARARGRERQQLKWFAYAVGMAVIAFLAGILIIGGGHLFPVFGVVPVAAALAILRHRLYDIDLVLNRTLVYGLLTAVLGLGYAVAVILLGRLLGRDSNLAVAGATLAVTVLFGPARRRIQAVVDRRFDRRRYDAGRTIDAFAARLRREVGLATVTSELLATAERTVGPSRVSLWLRPGAPRS